VTEAAPLRYQIEMQKEILIQVRSVHGWRPR
jgi:hypothetical protein